MQKIRIDEIRVDGFRGLKDFKMSLLETTLLTGMNNVGKTSVLKSLQLLFGNGSFISAEDLHIDKDEQSSCIIVDAKIVSISEEGKRIDRFSDAWEIAFSENSIKIDVDGYVYVPLRVKYTFNKQQSSFERDMIVLNEWEKNGTDWRDLKGKRSTIKGDLFQFYYMDAKRDILDDIKLRTSFLGRMLGSVVGNYNNDFINEIEQVINNLNNKAIENSKLLKDIQDSLNDINSTMDSFGKIYISPFAKKLRDLNHSLTIHYGTEDNSFTMDYHGMGTRSWVSMLSFKAFIKQINDSKNIDEEAFLPIIAIEEPEAHLHPNAQKQLYKQMNETAGIKIISTHSPYVAACADLSELRGLYKSSEKIVCGSLPVDDLSPEELRRIKQAVLMSHGEILFAKAIILVEGETEVQALPIFYQKYEGAAPFEAGLLFIDAKGYGNYFSFIVLAESFHIPWFIFSDGEQQVRSNLEKLLCRIHKKDLDNQENIFIIPDGCDFEKMLLENGYINEIETAIKQLKGEHFIDNYIKKNNHKHKERKQTNKKCHDCKQPINEAIEIVYDGEKERQKALDAIMGQHKAMLAPLLANCIIESGKDLPPLVVELFDEIKRNINYV